jgi:hypothetical protein
MRRKGEELSMRYTSLLESRIYNQVCHPLLRIDITNCKVKNDNFNINLNEYVI